jgi:hypothetical protein
MLTIVNVYNCWNGNMTAKWVLHNVVHKIPNGVLCALLSLRVAYLTIRDLK